MNTTTNTCSPFYRVNHYRECEVDDTHLWCDADPRHEHTESVFGEVTCAHCYGHGGYESIAGRDERCTSCNGAGDTCGHRADWAREGWARNARLFA